MNPTYTTPGSRVQRRSIKTSLLFGICVACAHTTPPAGPATDPTLEPTLAELKGALSTNEPLRSLRELLRHQGIAAELTPNRPALVAAWGEQAAPVVLLATYSPNDSRALQLYSASLIALRKKYQTPRGVLLVAASDTAGLAAALALRPNVGTATIAFTWGGPPLDPLGSGAQALPLAYGTQGWARIQLAVTGPDAALRLAKALLEAPDALPRANLGSAGPLRKSAAKAARFPRNLFLQTRFGAELLFLEQWLSAPALRNQVQSSLQISGLEAAPERARAWLDARLLPGLDPAALAARLRSRVGSGVHVTVVDGESASLSALDGRFEALERQVLASTDFVAPILADGPAEAHLLRKLGVPVYGWAPPGTDLEAVAQIVGAVEMVATPTSSVAGDRRSPGGASRAGVRRDFGPATTSR